MTREQAKEIISYHKHLVDKDKSGLLIKEIEYQAIDMAIKALEQEPILDKIRAEITKLQTYKMFVGENTVYVERDDVLDILDKYRAESEVEK